MTANSRTQAAVDAAIAHGIRRVDAAPLFHRMLWAAGFDLRPPHYAAFGNNALLMGGFWGLWMAAFGAFYAWHLHPGAGVEIVIKPICIALVAAVAFGLAMATVVRSGARKAKLPRWDDIGVSER